MQRKVQVSKKIKQKESVEIYRRIRHSRRHRNGDAADIMEEGEGEMEE